MSRKKLNRFNYFAKRLNQLLKNTLNITQKEFCDKVGISEAYLSMILNKKVGPSAELIAGIFLNYNEHLHYLLTGEENSREIKIAEQEIPYGENKGEITKLLKMTTEVLTSDTGYSQSLALNIHSFHQAVTDSHDFETRLKALEKKESGKPRKAATEKTARIAPTGDATKKEAI